MDDVARLFQHGGNRGRKDARHPSSASSSSSYQSSSSSSAAAVRAEDGGDDEDFVPIRQHVLKRKRIIRLPAHAAAVQRKMLQAADEFRESMGCEPTQEELQAIVGASETVVKATMHSGRNTVKKRSCHSGFTLYRNTLPSWCCRML